MRTVISTIFLISACGSSDSYQSDLLDGGQAQKRSQSEPFEQIGSSRRETQIPLPEILDAGLSSHDTRPQDAHSLDTAPSSDALPAFLQPKQDAALTWKSKEVKPGVFLLYKGDDIKPVPYCQGTYFSWYQIHEGKTYVFLHNSTAHCSRSPDLSFPYPSIFDIRKECADFTPTRETVNNFPETIPFFGKSYTEVYVTNLMKVCSNSAGICKFGACYDSNNKIIP